MAQFQVNLQVTMINSNLVDDSTLRKALKLKKNEIAAIDVQQLAAKIAEHLADRDPQACRRSKSDNLTISLPFKVEVDGLLTKADANAEKKSTTKKTDAEKRSALLSDLGL